MVTLRDMTDTDRNQLILIPNKKLLFWSHGFSNMLLDFGPTEYKFRNVD